MSYKSAISLLFSTIIFCSFVALAQPTENQILAVNELQLNMTSYSVMHSVVFLSQTVDEALGADTVDVLCQDGDIRLRVSIDSKIKEFRSKGDFYCYSSIALAAELDKKPALSINFEFTMIKEADENKISSAIFKFSDGSNFDLYAVKNSTLRIRPLTESN